MRMWSRRSAQVELRTDRSISSKPPRSTQTQASAPTRSISSSALRSLLVLSCSRFHCGERSVRSLPDAAEAPTADAFDLFQSGTTSSICSGSHRRRPRRRRRRSARAGAAEPAREHTIARGGAGAIAAAGEAVPAPADPPLAQQHRRKPESFSPISAVRKKPSRGQQQTHATLQTDPSEAKR